MCFVPGHGKGMWKGKDRKEGKEEQSGEEKEICGKEEGKTIWWVKGGDPFLQIPHPLSEEGVRSPDPRIWNSKVWFLEFRDQLLQRKEATVGSQLLKKNHLN